MFTSSFWNYICDSLVESLVYSFGIDRDAFEITEIIGNGIKRTVDIKVKISDYSMFKKSFKQIRSEFQEYPCNPFYERQYRNGKITLFVKPQDEIYDIEDFNGFFEEKDLEYRRDMELLEFYNKQYISWSNRVYKAYSQVSYAERFYDYEDYKLEKENLAKLQKIEFWYSEQMRQIMKKYNIEVSYQ